MSDVPIRFVTDIGESPETSKPGDAEWSVHDSSPHAGKKAGLLFMCPCGCGSLGDLLIIPMDSHPKWSWNGSEDRPSFTPSIQKTSACRWHGYLTDGVFRSV